MTGRGAGAHTRGMRIWLAGVLGALLIGSVPSAAAPVRGDRPGPPPWAASHSHAHHDHDHGRAGDHDAWKDAWKALTPAERRDRMAGLVDAHRMGMKHFGACMRAADGDRAARAACDKPMPPGLAKKQP